ncbi:uncharacterized protein LOC144133785 [Amblyomma americanum]
MPTAKRSSLAELKGAGGSSTGVECGSLPSCTASQHRTCQVVGQIDVLNELLFPARVELRDLSGQRTQLCLVSFDEPGLYLPDPAGTLLHEAVTLLCWLLKAHHCLGSFYVRSHPLNRHAAMVCGALRCNSSLTTLKFHFLGLAMKQALCDTLRWLTHLEELECATFGECPDDLLNSVSALLQSSSLLSTLRIPGLRMNTSAAKIFFNALKANHTLKELSVHESAVGEAGRDTFLEYMNIGSRLISVEIVADIDNRRSSISQIAEGLLTNKTVRNVSLKYIPMHPEGAQLAARLFEENEILRSFTVTSLPDNSRIQPGGEYQCLLTALAKNETLEELRLPFHIWNLQQWVVFFGVVSAKESLKIVTIDLPVTNREIFLILCSSLRESGAEGKVSFGSYYISEDFDFIDCKAFSDIYVYLPTNDAIELLRQLPMFEHITSMHITIWIRDEARSSAVADYVGATHSLRKLELTLCSNVDDRMDATSRSWNAMMGSISRNTSIRQLQVSIFDNGGVLCREQSEHLAEVIGSSRNMRRVRFYASHPAITGAFLRRLSADVANNYTLVSFTVSGGVHTETAADCLAVWNTTRRNTGLVSRAKEFADGRRCDGYCARALEPVRRHPALLEELAEMQSVSVAVATAMLQRALKGTEGMRDFMRLAGVVKESVVCSESHDGRPQLVDLDADSWAHLRHYLTLDDVSPAYGANVLRPLTGATPTVSTGGVLPRRCDE